MSDLARTAPSLRGILARCWRNWKRARLNIFDLKDCSLDESARIACYLGISAAELRCIASYGPERLKLLPRRMAALALDAGVLACADYEIWRELERRCASCDSRGRCALDLAHALVGAGGADWAEYCPNATTLSNLAAIQGRPDDLAKSPRTSRWKPQACSRAPLLR